MICIQFLDSSPNPKKRRRLRNEPPDRIDTLPQDWRDLAVRWLRRAKGAASCRWETLTKDAGPANYALAQRLLEWLLAAGWVAITEERRHGNWWPARVEFRESAHLRSLLGLPDPAEPVRQWAALRAEVDFAHYPDLAAAMAALDGLPAVRAVDRARLLRALSLWRDESRTGTRRDFAQFARGATKAITDAEWRWLEDSVDLAADGIERHTPLLLVAAPLVLELPRGALALHGAPDFSAITPATLAATARMAGNIVRWRVIENRTSFERLARTREHDTGIVWLPGFPPTWWRDAMSRLIAWAPAPADIACDPDPAGIAIALEAGNVWDAAGLGWRPWRMDTSDLAALKARKPIAATDIELLHRLLQNGLPDPLHALAQWMLTHGEKGEQEGYL